MAALRLSRAFPTVSAEQFMASSKWMNLATKVLEDDVKQTQEAAAKHRQQAEEAHENANWYVEAMARVANAGRGGS